MAVCLDGGYEGRVKGFFKGWEAFKEQHKMSYNIYASKYLNVRLSFIQSS